MCKEANVPGGGCMGGWGEWEERDREEAYHQGSSSYSRAREDFRAGTGI